MAAPNGTDLALRVALVTYYLSWIGNSLEQAIADVDELLVDRTILDAGDVDALMAEIRDLAGQAA